MSIVIRDPRIEITPDVKILARTDGRFVVFDRRLPLGSNAGEFDASADATTAARSLYASEIKPKGPAKISKSDDELFAAMRRAQSNGFARHEPAYSEGET